MDAGKYQKMERPLQLWLGLLALCLAWAGSGPLYADDFQWAQRGVNPQEAAPKALRNNISLEMINAVEGLFEPRFQHYFRDSLAYYLQLQLGSNLASGLNFAEEFNDLPYNSLQLGFEVGMTSLLYARNSKVTKDTRRWGSGIILGLGFRFMFSNISGETTTNIFSFGITSNLGWQLQARNFSVSMYLGLRVLLHISTKRVIDGSFPVLLDRGPLSRSLPNIPMVNSSQVSVLLASNSYYSFSQTLNIRISYYF